MTFLRLLTAKQGDKTTSTLVNTPEQLAALQLEAAAHGVTLTISYL